VNTVDRNWCHFTIDKKPRSLEQAAELVWSRWTDAIASYRKILLTVMVKQSKRHIH